MGWPEAMSDAATLIRRNSDLPGHPQILISDDDILTIEWHRDGQGALLLFDGDGSVTLSFRRPGAGYGENCSCFPVDGELPQAFREALARIAPR